MVKEIAVKFGYTANMGNYESLRLDLGITKTTDCVIEEDEAIKEGSKLIDKLEKEVMKKIENLEQEIKR